MFFVDHDQLQMRHGGEHRHAGAQHNPCAARVGRQPALQALRRCHAAVHGHHLLGPEARDHALLQLRRQIDLGHHQQGLGFRVGFEASLHGLQIDLGFAAAGGPKNQERPGLGGDLRQGLRLLSR